MVAQGAPLQLSLDQAVNWALENHPLGIMANAVEERGPAALMRSRGNLDPKFYSTYDRKQFLGTEYFNYGETGIEWQSPAALKFSAGYQFAAGTYLNDELVVPDAGQAYIAVKLPILQGLLVDETRTDLRQGDLEIDRNRADADIIRNELRYDIALRFADWAYTERILDINRETLRLIEQRFRDTRGLFEQGDKPAVDTLEVYVSLGTQRLTVQQAEVDAQLARQAFNELYWPMDENTSPLTLDDRWTTIPATAGWLMQHPDLIEKQLGLAQIQLEQRLKREKLKPKLDVGYYLLGDGFDISPVPVGGENGGFFTRAYKLDATFSYPIFNRKARGDVQLGQLKITETTAKIDAKQQALSTKADAYRNAVRQFDNQLAEGQDLAVQASRLLDAERRLFSLGESTQFLLNSREQSLQKARLTVAKLSFSQIKAVLTYRYVTAQWE
jgi:outer membrane protein TolC